MQNENENKEIPKMPLKRKESRGSIYKDLKDVSNLLRPEFQLSKDDDKNQKVWSIMKTYLPRDKVSVQKSIIYHVEFSLARTRFDITPDILYTGTSISVRDRLLESWNDTQVTTRLVDPKRVYYLSIEFLLGRLLQNALINMNLDKPYNEAIMDFGVKLEEVYERENDPALGNGGLGRLAACFLDSLTTLNYPAWGYGIRYDYGIFRQAIENFQQKEFPDYWLTKGNAWEIQRLDVKYKVRFYGKCRDEIIKGKKVRIWDGGNEVVAIAYDTMIPGWNTFMANTLRLWKSFPDEEFDFDSFNKGDFLSAMQDKDTASFITSVLYPNDSTWAGKELRLKQQYFFVSATIQDILRRFLRSELPWKEFPKKTAIQLNDTHPTVAIPELMRILVDIHGLEYEDAFDIVNQTFAYTNHTVLPEALEKWSVDLFGNLLPRHLELIYMVNHIFLEKAKKRFPNNSEKISRLSMIEEGYPKMIRMANLAIVGSHCVNGVARMHSELLKTSLFKDFHEFFPKKFKNVTNGVTPRRWIHCAFPELSEILTRYTKNDDWLSDLTLLETLYEDLKNDNKLDEFFEDLFAAKIQAKNRLCAWVKNNCNIDITPDFLFDVMVKRIHEYKRQLMNAFYCAYKYIRLLEMSPEDRKKEVKRISFFGGKAAPGYIIAKNVIRLIGMIGNVVNNDPEIKQYYKVIFLPDYKVSVAQIIIPAADISEHISTAGTEASGTSNMKFAMTGSLIVGTRDGANVEIGEQIKEENIYFFGKNINEVDKIRSDMNSGKKNYVGKQLKKVFDYILSGKFGNIDFFKDYLNNLMLNFDFYLVCHDFESYIQTQDRVDRDYQDKKKWETMCLLSISRMGFFSSDRSINEYAETIWKVDPIEVPKPETGEKRVYSSTNLKSMENLSDRSVKQENS